MTDKHFCVKRETDLMEFLSGMNQSSSLRRLGSRKPFYIFFILQNYATESETIISVGMKTNIFIFPLA